MAFDTLLKSPEQKKPGTREEPTITAIQENFLYLLKKRPIEKISVAELCQRCQINRSTFYRHYADLYALLDSIVEEAHSHLFYDVIRKVDLREDFDEVGYQYILKVCETTEKQKELYRLLLFGKTSTGLYDRMTESSYQLYEMAHEGPSAMRPSEDAPLHYRFLVNGMIGVWAAWVRDGCKTPKERVARAMQEQIIGFYQTMGRLFGKNAG